MRCATYRDLSCWGWWLGDRGRNALGLSAAVPLRRWILSLSAGVVMLGVVGHW